MLKNYIFSNQRMMFTPRIYHWSRCSMSNKQMLSFKFRVLFPFEIFLCKFFLTWIKKLIIKKVYGDELEIPSSIAICVKTSILQIQSINFENFNLLDWICHIQLWIFNAINLVICWNLKVRLLEKMNFWITT